MGRRVVDMREPILEAEIKEWSAKSCDELLAELSGGSCYPATFGTKTFQCEVQIVENTDAFLRLAILIDDGTEWGALKPFGGDFIVQKGETPKA
jgi:hypothetical protein